MNPADDELAAFRERFDSVQVLDPSPVEDSPEQVKGEYFPPRPGHLPASSSTLGLSGGPGSHHGAVYYLSRIQKYSSYTFATFLALHLTNTSLIPLVTQSASSSDSFLLLTRPFYQSPVAEPLLVLLPVAAHVGSGLALRLYRTRQLARRYGADTRAERKRLRLPKLSGTSFLGWVLVPLMAGHAFINRALPMQIHGSSSGIGLTFVTHGFAKAPLVSLVGFTLLIGVGAWHIVWGSARWLGWTPDQVTAQGSKRISQKRRRWIGVNGMSLCLTAAWIAGGIGVVGRDEPVGGWVGQEYDEVYRRIPLVGKWL